jgi:hypothetical protein
MRFRHSNKRIELSIKFSVWQCGVSERLLTLADAADELGVSRSTLTLTRRPD